MIVAVVGASGVLGRALVPALQAAGHDVRSAAPSLSGIDVLSSDLAPLLDGCDAVVHAATAIPRDPTAPGAWDLNTRLRIEGTRRLVDACHALGVQRYVQQSITLAYRDGGDAWLDESTPFDDPARYSVVAPVIDMESQVRASGLSWTILRGGSFVGPGTGQQTEIARLRAGSLRLVCEGAYWLSPIHPADYAQAFVLSLQNDAALNQVFNVADSPVLYATYVETLAAAIGAPLPVRLPRDPSRPCPASHRVLSAAAETALGWRPSHPVYPAPEDLD